MAADALRAAPAIPRATYRLQFHAGFRLVDALPLVPYFARLGVSHLYASPLLKARPGSTHGYDIVDHGALNPEVGSREDLDALVEALHAHGMGLVLDIVPNHMGVGSDNGWWMDVLEHGPASERAAFFDVDWEPAKPELRGRVLLPVLGDSYGATLSRGELRLELDAEAGRLQLRYWDHRHPLDPRTWPEVLRGDDPAREVLAAALAAEGEAGAERRARFESLLTALERLPPREQASPEARAERARDARLHARSLAALLAESAALRAHVARALARFRVDGVDGAGVPAGPDAGTDTGATATAAGATARLHALLERQPYRLAYWRTAADEINYRRFFDINDLAGLRQEDPAVFAATHRLVLELVASGAVDGLRIDHPDGLRDPAGYYARLADAVRALPGRGATARGGGGLPIYVLAEKILQGYERLPRGWAIHGTTGYDWLALAGAWFTYRPAERAFLRTYERFTGRKPDLDDELYHAKKLIQRVALASELTVLANRLNRLSEADVRTRDYTLTALREALAETAACFPVYRTYVTAAGASDEDRRWVDWALAQAKRRSVALDLGIFDFLRRVLLFEGFETAPEPVRREALGVAERFQQYTAPLMAKGLEDTVFYRWHGLVAANEVGGHPRHVHTTTAALHRAARERARDWPHAMLASSTHDTKRSEDVRARLRVLTELAPAWRERVERWARLNGRRKRRPDERTEWPGPRIEYLLYQTLVGAWPVGGFAMPAFRERIRAHARKAVREAKVHTSWIAPHAEFEAALDAFVDALLPDELGGPFLADFAPFAARVAWFGALGSLSQQLLKLTNPGVPDLYQGTELLDDSLVDPDNRRPVDYGRRRALLDALDAMPPADSGALLHEPTDGRAKLWLTRRALALRAAQPAVFRDGGYEPLAVHGARAEHVCAYLRRGHERAVLVVATRWHATATGGETRLPLGEAVWDDTSVALPARWRGRAWRDALTDAPIGPAAAAATGDVAATGATPDALPLSRLLASWPVALLTAE